MGIILNIDHGEGPVFEGKHIIDAVGVPVRALSSNGFINAPKSPKSIHAVVINCAPLTCICLVGRV